MPNNPARRIGGPAQTEIPRHFQAYLEDTGLSHISVKNYVSDIRQFLVWSKLSSARLITSELISEYLKLIKESKPNATYRRYFASMRRFVTFLSTEYRLELSLSPSTPLMTAPLSLGQITQQFKTFLIKEKRTPATIKNYVSDLNHFWSWSAKFVPAHESSAGLDLSTILSPKTLKTYLNHLKVSHITTSVAHRREAAINKFIKFAIDTKLISDIPVHLGPQPLAWFRRYQSTDKLVSQAGGKQSLYRRYNNLPFVPYFHLALLVLFTTALGLFAYNQIIRQATPQFAYPTALTRPTRQLSFQGRLTDSSDTPITTATNVSFKIWDQLSAGTEGTCTSQAGEDCLYKTGTCSVDPDDDGIFNVLIGDTVCGAEIPNTVFSENPSVFLEVLVGAQTLTPRQQIATVAFALNSETLQGYPASASAVENTIPVMNNNGDIILGSSSPTIKSTSDTFGIEGQALSLITTAGTNGNISIAPDGTGAINAIGGTTTQDFLRITNANLTSGSLISGYVGNNTSDGELLRLSSGSSETDRFVVGSFGQTTIDAAAKGKAALIVNQLDTGPIFAASVAGVNRFLIANSGDVTMAGDDFITTSSTFNLINTTATTLNLGGAATTFNIAPTGASGSIVFSGGSGDTGCTLDGTTGNYTCSGNITSIATGTPSVGYWTRNTASGYLYPATATDLIGINSSSPNSTLDVRSNLGTVPVASISGATSMAALVVDNSGVGDIFTASSSGLNRFVITQNGNVGIGTTVPSYLLDVQGGTGIVAQFSGRVIGADAVNSNEFATLSQVSGGGGPWTRSAPNVYLTTGTDYVGIGTTSPLATLDVRSNLGTIPVASISGATSMAALVVDNSGVGDIFTASSSGLNRFVITQNGNVGIGTTAPSEKLEINGNINFTSTALFKIAGATRSRFSTSGWDDGGNTRAFNLAYGNGTITNVPFSFTGDVNTGLFSGAADNVGLVTGATERLRVDSSGNVGIGTTGPGYRLQVENTATGLASQMAVVNSVSTDYIGSSILLQSASTTRGNGIFALNGTSEWYMGTPYNNDVFTIARTASATHSLANAQVASSLLTINTSGNVGIGTTAPTSLLHVTGAVKGKALVIFNETGDQNIFSASQSGIPVFDLARVAGTAANGVTLTPATAGNGPTLAATGSDTNIAYSIDSKGTGALNLNNNATGDVLLAGGVSATGCTVTNSNGNLSCTGDITSSGASGFQGWWQRNSLSIAPTNIADDVLIGSIATASALTKFSGTPSGNSWINTGYLGVGTITPTAHLAIVGNTWEGLFSINDGTDNIATISSTLSQFNNPVSFTSPGDVAIAYDLNFTNQTSSYIKSNAPLYIQAGESFENNDLTLQTFGTGGVIVAPANTTTTLSGTSYALQIVPNLTSATNSLAHTMYNQYSVPTINETGTGVGVTTLYNDYIGLTKTAGTITNYYGEYIAAPTGAGTVTNTYALVTEASAGNVGIGDVSPDYTLELSGATAPKLALSDTELAHGVTSWAETDSYFLIEEVTNDDGGARLWGFSDSVGQNPLRLIGAFGSTDPTDTVPGIWFIAGKKSGTSIADLGALETAFQFSGGGGSNHYMTILGSGNVGIGSISPGSKLDIVDTSNTAASLTITNNTATTIGAGVNTLGIVDIQSTSLTTGNLVNLEANALSSGRVLNASTTSTALSNTTTGSLLNLTASGAPAGSWTGSLALIEHTSTSANVDGSALKLGFTGASAGDGAVLNITTAQTGTAAYSLRVNDTGTYADTSPFVIMGNVTSKVGFVGIGTTNPSEKLHVVGKLTLSDTLYPINDATQNLGIATSNEFANLHLSTSIQRGGVVMVNLATQTLGDQSLTPDAYGWTIEQSASISGTLGGTQLVVPGVTYLGCTLGGTATIPVGTAPSCTAGGGAVMVAGNFGDGKIDVGTVDPPYTINGKKYATYLPGMIGQNEEVVGQLTVDELVENLGYKKVIDFTNLPMDSKLWLFSRIIDVAKHIGDITVMLTPSSSAKTWYEIDQDKLLLTIYSNKPTNLSYRLTAPRFDSDQWPMIREEGSRGFLIETPELSPNNLDNDTLIALDPVFTEKNINEYELKLGNNVVTEIGSYAKLLVANLTAGLVKAEKLVSPLADIETLSADTVSTITLSAVEGQISNIKSQIATISGTLFASDIQSPILDSKFEILNSNYASASAILAAIKAKYSEFDSLNSPVVQTDPLSTSSLDSNNATISGNLSLNTSYSILNTVVADTLLVNTTLVSNSLNSNDTALYLQPTANQPINLLAGLMTLTPDGKVAINGDLSVSGNLYAQNIISDQSQISNLTSQIATISGSFTSNTATVSGSIASNEIITNGLLIASASTESATATSSANLSSNASIGTGIISAGETELKIENSKIKNSTYIYLTPISDSANQVLYIKSKEEGVGFTVAINQALPADVKFSYWLIQTQP